MDTEALLAQALEAMRGGSLAEAESACRVILAVFPRHYRALTLLAEILALAGREAESLSVSKWAEMAKPGRTPRFTELSTERFRKAFGPAVSPVEADEKKRRVQMLSLGQRGRFGNQLLQYAFVRLYARQHNLVAEFPDWIGRDVYDFDDPFPSIKFPALDETEADLFGSLSGRTGQVFTERDMRGHFGGNTKEWAAWKLDFCALFESGHKVRAILDQALGNLRSRGKKIVAIHLRRGDFGYGQFWVAPSSWYIAWLKTIWSCLELPTVYIASDLPGAHAEFSEFNACTLDQLGVNIPGAEFLIDHHILRHADHLAISNSSFSFTAAMLNGHAKAFLRPDPNLRKLVTFDPWSSPVSWKVNANPRAVATPDKLFVRNQILPTGAVVYWGSHCSEWTNYARSVYDRLKIFEIEGDSPAADMLQRRNIQHAQLLVLENASILFKFFEAAEEILGKARIDMVLIHLDVDVRADLVSDRFSAMGYVLIRLVKNTFPRNSTNKLTLKGSYVAIREEKVSLFRTQGSSFDFSPQNLLSRLSGWFGRHQH